MNQLTRNCLKLLLTLGLVFQVVISHASVLTVAQARWANANYQLQDQAQITSFESIIADLDEELKKHPEDASLLIWRGINKSSLAGAKGGLGGLSLAKASRKDFEAALAIDAKALQGSAHTSLGTLYSKVPSWPIGFGSDKKAKKHLLTALEINPNGIDPNYFYALYLFDHKQYQQAKEFLLKAQQAPSRPTRPLADEGRHKEIIEMLTQIDLKLN